MKILLVSATQAEIEPYLLTAPKHDVLITGVGLPAAIFNLSRHLSHHRYDLVVQAGISGANANAYPLGSVIAIRKDCFAGLGSWEQNSFNALHDLGLSTEKIWYHAATHWLQQCKLPIVDGATVATLTNNGDFLGGLQHKWPHEAETMEGACCYFVCNHLQQACIQIRSVSNALGDRNKANWKIDLAINNLNNFLSDWLMQLVHK